MLGALFVPVPRRELEHIAETMQEQKKNGKRERRVEERKGGGEGVRENGEAEAKQQGLIKLG